VGGFLKSLGRTIVGALSGSRIVRDNLVYMPFFVAVSLLNYIFQVVMARSLSPGHFAVMVASLSLVAIVASPGVVLSSLTTRTVGTNWSAESFTQLRRLLWRVWIWLGRGRCC